MLPRCPDRKPRAAMMCRGRHAFDGGCRAPSGILSETDTFDKVFNQKVLSRSPLFQPILPP